MTENTTEEQQSEIIDFGFDATEADIARPVMQNGVYDADVSFVRSEKTKNTQMQQLVMGFRLTQEAKDTNGKPINPGFTVIHRFLVEPTGGLTKQMIEDRLKRYQVGIAGPGRVSTANWVGKSVRIKVTIREARTDEKTGNTYEASNEIGGIYPAKKQ
jgi:hypothetical protein